MAGPKEVTIAAHLQFDSLTIAGNQGRLDMLVEIYKAQTEEPPVLHYEK